MLNKYGEDGSCLLTEKEKKEFSFVCIKCYKINSINFDEIANRETIKLMKSGRITKCCNITSVYSEKQRVSGRFERSKIRIILYTIFVQFYVFIKVSNDILF